VHMHVDGHWSGSLKILRTEKLQKKKENGAKSELVCPDISHSRQGWR
ncbi:Hypothetical protein DHA2_151850, partial [Giardia duodenalis]